MEINTNLAILKNKISNFIIEIGNNIEIERNVGKNTEIHNLENYIKDFFNILYNLDETNKFINLNTNQMNFPGADLFSESRKEFVQVTVTNTVAKLKDSIEKTEKYLVSKGEDVKEYTFTFFSYKPLKGISNISSSQFKKIKFIDHIGLLREIDSAEIEKLEKINKIIEVSDSFEFELPVLGQIIQCLSKKGKMIQTNLVDPFKIELKIKHNELLHFMGQIKNMAMYSGYIDSVIQEYEKNGNYNMKLFIISAVVDKYDKIKIKDKIQSNEDVYYRLIDELSEEIKIKNLTFDKVKGYMRSLVAYVFCECHIFEKPPKEENYDS